MLLQDPGGRARAPAPLDLVQQFVNTLDIENDVELLTSPKDLARVLVHLGLLRRGERVRDVDLRTALEVREALRGLALANNGVPLPDDVPVTLERAARAAQFTLSFGDAAAARLTANAGGVDGALGQLLAVVHAAMLEGTWARLKGCPRDVCHWLFYDRSRNASSKWCAMSVCGNRTNTRAYRRRVSGSA